MIRLARIATDPKWAHALHRDLIRDQQTLDGIGWLGLKAYIDHPPAGTALDRALHDGWSLSDHLAAHHIYATQVEGWSIRSLTRALRGIETIEPFPQQLPRPGVEVELTEVEQWEAVDDITDLMTPEVIAMIREG